MRITRRQMLALGSSALLAGTGLLTIRWYRKRQWTRIYGPDELAALDYLRPDPAGVEKFVAAYLEHHVARPGKAHLPHLETTYLMSSDFFSNGQPPAGPVHYVTIFHPYRSPCYNPLADTSAG